MLFSGKKKSSKKVVSSYFLVLSLHVFPHENNSSSLPYVLFSIFLAHVLVYHNRLNTVYFTFSVPIMCCMQFFCPYPVLQFSCIFSSSVGGVFAIMRCPSACLSVMHNSWILDLFYLKAPTTDHIT